MLQLLSTLIKVGDPRRALCQPQDSQDPTKACCSKCHTSRKHFADQEPCRLHSSHTKSAKVAVKKELQPQTSTKIQSTTLLVTLQAVQYTRMCSTPGIHSQAKRTPNPAPLQWPSLFELNTATGMGCMRKCWPLCRPLHHTMQL